MNALYPFFISFIMIFLAELGDKTQLLVLSFSSKGKTKNILLGIALGTLCSHGIAIIFGSRISTLQNESVLHWLKILTYFTFLILGITGFLKQKNNKTEPNNKFIKKISNMKINYIFIIALSIIIGELGDKTFIASMGLGVEYSNYKISLIIGAILGMVASNSVAIIFGRIIEKIIPSRYVQLLSNIIFIIFGIVGLIVLI